LSEGDDVAVTMGEGIDMDETTARHPVCFTRETPVAWRQ
jgi:hypothetical protein